MRVRGPVAAVIGFLLLLGVAPLVLGGGNSALACAGVSVDAQAVSGKSIEGYKGDQLLNAVSIINTAATMGLSREAQVIGIMTAMGESGLRNVGYGDDINGVTNPDGTPTCSLGLFQQQWCIGGSWGSKDEVMDPVHAATKFFERLVTVKGWEDMEPTMAAHRVQANADPTHYAKFQKAAEAVVDGLAGQTCSAGGSGAWVTPVNAPITSPYGPREVICNSVGCSTPFHYGLDFGAACGTPINAIGDGTVTFTGGAGDFGNRVIIDHGDGIESIYGHVSAQYPVKQGQTVTAGTPVATVGGTGVGTGCHLDLKIQLNGEHTDPRVFLKEHGVNV